MCIIREPSLGCKARPCFSPAPFRAAGLLAVRDAARPQARAGTVSGPTGLAAGCPSGPLRPVWILPSEHPRGSPRPGRARACGRANAPSRDARGVRLSDDRSRTWATLGPAERCRSRMASEARSPRDSSVRWVTEPARATDVRSLTRPRCPPRQRSGTSGNLPQAQALFCVRSGTASSGFHRMPADTVGRPSDPASAGRTRTRSYGGSAMI